MAISRSLLLWGIMIVNTIYLTHVREVSAVISEPTTVKPEPEKPKPEPEKTNSPSAETIANYATLGVLLGVFFIAAVIFAILWWRARAALRFLRAQPQQPQKFGPPV